LNFASGAKEVHIIELAKIFNKLLEGSIERIGCHLLDKVSVLGGEEVDAMGHN
jgi:hypothetical protein